MARLVVVGVDGSPNSLAAVRWAANSASTKRAVLRLVCVWTPLPWHGVPESLRRALEIAQPRDAAAAGFVLRSALHGCDLGGRRVESYVVEGTPGPALVEASGDADVLVVGVDGHGGGARSSGASTGPTAQYVTRHAPCPTIMIRHSPAISGGARRRAAPHDPVRLPVGSANQP